MGRKRRRLAERDNPFPEAESWKNQAPYRIHAKHERFQVHYQGFCHCRRVIYHLNRKEPLDSKFCHCNPCQVQHGAPFQWGAIFHKEDINFVEGTEGLEFYNSDSYTTEHVLPCKVRCAHCHTPIMDEGRNMILLFPSLIQFWEEEDKVLFKPKCHIFYSERVVDMPDGLPKWSRIDKRSKLIEDSPQELVESFNDAEKKTENEWKFWYRGEKCFT